MKTNPDDSINAFYGDTYQSADGYITSNYFNAGLSKREYFAAMAMQGLQSKPIMYVSHDSNKEVSFELLRKEHARRAVEIADALIEELNK
jgi:hypothetical protein